MKHKLPKNVFVERRVAFYFMLIGTYFGLIISLFSGIIQKFFSEFEDGKFYIMYVSMVVFSVIVLGFGTYKLINKIEKEVDKIKKGKKGKK